MNTFYIYRYIRLDTNTPFYVGKGIGRRAYDIKRNRNKYFKNIIASIPYEIEIIVKDLTNEQSFIKEIEFIKLYKNLGYCEANLTYGGEGKLSCKMSEKCKNILLSKEVREKARISLLGRKLSQETKNKISVAHKGKNHKGSANKLVIDKRTGFIWDSAKEASSIYNINLRYLYNQLSGYSTNLTFLEYVD